MFILRKLVFEGVFATESNQILGDHYHVVTKNNSGWEQLNEKWKAFENDIHTFIVYNNGSEVIPLYKKQGAYIMTSDGKTFSNLTYKGQ